MSNTQSKSGSKTETKSASAEEFLDIEAIAAQHGLEALDNTIKRNADGTIDTSEWVEEQVGFTPYWEVEQGKYFLGIPSARDERDPEFVRYVFTAVEPTVCQRGSKRQNEVEQVIVQPGEQFSISVWKVLERVFDEYFEIGVTPMCKVTALREKPVKSDNTKTYWEWKVEVSPATKKKLAAKRAEVHAMRKAAEKAAIAAAKSETAKNMS